MKSRIILSILLVAVIPGLNFFLHQVFVPEQATELALQQMNEDGSRETLRAVDYIWSRRRRSVGARRPSYLFPYDAPRHPNGADTGLINRKPVILVSRPELDPAAPRLGGEMSALETVAT